MPTLPKSSVPQPDLRLEIAHLLLIDIVGYSKLLVNAQIETVQELGRIVRGTDCFQQAEAKRKLIRVPTGDGMALLFFHSPEDPVRCALEIATRLKEHPEIQVRMGIHSGPVNQIRDVNDQMNVAGAGINVAQRVMDCGDAGHILVSKHVADDLAQYGHWQPYLADLGEYEVKHGLRLRIVNLCKDGVGNPALPEKLTRKKIWQRQPATVRPIRPTRYTPILSAFLIVAVLGIALTWIISLRARHSTPSSRIADAVPEKSIAVLPFENLSDDKQNVYFSDGVQDEILTDLSKVADLKVISRTSVMQYKSDSSRNLREIAKALGVAHIVEGTVQRIGDHVRVSAQLIDARNDVHLWAEHYDRELADVFALESELAEQIVDKLKAKLSPQEKSAIEQRPTSDLTAYSFYLRAKSLDLQIDTSAQGSRDLFEAANLLEQAVARDASFFVAYCLLARVYDQLFFFGIDRSTARLQFADSAVKTAFRLRPNAGEAHLALARHYYWGFRDYQRAEGELALAARTLPNEPLLFELAGYMHRRQGLWKESTRELEHALLLDPLNRSVATQMAFTYQRLRRFPEAAAVMDRALHNNPTDIDLRVYRAVIDLFHRADLKPLHSTFETILQQDAKGIDRVADHQLALGLYGRDPSLAEQALKSMSKDGYFEQNFPQPYGFSRGLVARLRGDIPGAKQAFTDARIQVEKMLQQKPDYAEAVCILGVIDAALGHREQAIREGQRAVELLPRTKDAMNGPKISRYLAVIYVWTGEKKLALDELSKLTEIPSDVNYGELRLNPAWDPLRGDPRFEKIVASLAPDAKP